MTDAEAARQLREIVRLATRLARDEDHLNLRNRAIEIAACAEIMLWSVAPDETEWLDRVYGGPAAGGGPARDGLAGGDTAGGAEQ